MVYIVNIAPGLGLTHCVTSGKLPSQVLWVPICEMKRLDKSITSVVFSSNIISLYCSGFQLDRWPPSNNENLSELKISCFDHKIKNRSTT